jgi:1-phosphofructokinase/tagatose 6-phosphate kinase
MIICVSANPAIDRRLRLESIAVGGVNRAVSAQPFLGGKAAHVAMVARGRLHAAQPTAWQSRRVW